MNHLRYFLILILMVWLLILGESQNIQDIACQDNEIATENLTKIVQVYVMFRHGVRSWVQTYPAERIPVSHWDNVGGLGQLTEVGRKQLADYGEFFKTYYINNRAFGKYFNTNRVVARSTDYNRTLNSAEAFLESLLGQTIPIISIPRDTPDKILHANTPCPRYYQQLRYESRNTAEYLRIESDNAEFIANMSVLSGITDLSYYHMWEIADHVLVNEAHGLPLPEWILENYEKIMQINDYTFDIDFVTTEMGRLIAGGLLNDIRTNIQDRFSSKSKNELYIYAVHDNYIAGMQKLLGTSENFVNPNFASSFILELSVDSKCNYYVRVMYKNDYDPTEISLTPVTIKGCEHLCPIDKFLELTKDKLVVPEEFPKVCELKKNSVFDPNE